MQLRPYAAGEATAGPGLSSAAPALPDQDCVEAIQENQVVIARMLGRVDLVREEVDARGLDWAEFDRIKEYAEHELAQDAAEQELEAESGQSEPSALRDGPEDRGETIQTSYQRHEAWRDGTFQTGVLRLGQGEITTDGRQQQQQQQQQQNGTDSRQTDGSEAMADADGGLHL